MDWKLSYAALLIALILSLFPNCRSVKEPVNPIEAVKRVVDKVVRDTYWEFQLVPQKEELGIQLIDFGRTYGVNINNIAYAVSFLCCDHDTTIEFGIDKTGPIRIWINDSLVFQNKDFSNITMKEIAYDMVRFSYRFKAHLKAGDNKVLVKSVCSEKEWQFLIRPLTEELKEEGEIEFNLNPVNAESCSSNWLCAGPFQISSNSIDHILNHKFPPEKEILPAQMFENGERIFSWTIPKKSVLVEIKSPYKRWAYNDWHYSTGALMMTLLDFSDVTNDVTYSNYVQKYADFLLSHRSYFQWQYQSLLALRGSYHRLFRRTMLDDTGAPALGLISLALGGDYEKYQQIITEVADYIMNEQVRLPDGTFCRPEPMPYTVWADDLFMSVPFLIRMYRMTGDSKYSDEAVNQVLLFTEKLYDEDKKLFNHGWYSESGNTSPVFWGRANGWVIWALSEALLYLPEKYPGYTKIVTIFQEHIDGLINYQDESGMWHQVLDHPESYEETSCTAMFTLGIARGIQNGWLDRSYLNRVILGWNAIEDYIEEDGTVNNICRGTGIGTSLKYYMNRPTFQNDPRGLGAVIAAGIEVDKLLGSLSK